MKRITCIACAVLVVFSVASYTNAKTQEPIINFAGLWKFPGKAVWIQIFPDGQAYQCRIAYFGSRITSKGELHDGNTIQWEQEWQPDQIRREGDTLYLKGINGEFGFNKTDIKMDDKCVKESNNSTAESAPTAPNDMSVLSGLWQDVARQDVFLDVSQNGSAIIWSNPESNPESNDSSCYLAYRSTYTNIGNDEYTILSDGGGGGSITATVENDLMTIRSSARITELIRRDDLDPNFLECPPGTQ